MSNKAYSYYKDLPQWAKGVVVVGGLAAIYFATRGFVKKIKEQSAADKANKSVKSAQADFDALVKKGINPTVTKAQTDAWANQIVKQFTGADLLLESKGVIENIFNKLQNDADYLMLFDSFGIRSYPDAFFGTVTNVDLASAIQDELFGTTISSLNKILSKKGINYSI